MPPGCSPACWADNDTIGNVAVNDWAGEDDYFVCGGEPMEPEEAQMHLNHVGVTECPDKNCANNTSTVFYRQVLCR